ncbi:MAG: hypothetical protein JST93_36230 [Acidobacteria bacterium]|nr:hypothetical protein [Acidobacteriota bacterium]
MKIRILLVVLMASPLFAGLTFQSAMLSGSPGSLLSFEGTVTNTWGVETYLNGVSLTVDAFAAEDVDLMPFLVNAPLSLVDGDSAGPFVWFTVAIPAAFAAGSYNGEFVLQGGPDAGAELILGVAPFQVQVDEPPATGVPEVSTGWVVGCLLLFRLIRSGWC